VKAFYIQTRVQYIMVTTVQKKKHNNKLLQHHIPQQNSIGHCQITLTQPFLFWFSLESCWTSSRHTAGIAPLDGAVDKRLRTAHTFFGTISPKPGCV